MTVGFWEEVLTKFDDSEPRDDRGRWTSDAGNPHDPTTWKGRGPLGPHWVSRIIPHDGIHRVQLDGKPVRCMSHGHCGSCGAAISVKKAGGYGHQTMSKPSDRYPVPGLKWNPARDAPKPAQKYDEDQPRDERGRWTDGGAVADPLGRWSGERFPPAGSGHTVMRNEGATIWGYSHSASQQVTGEAALLMGVPGYVSFSRSVDWNTGGTAYRFLSAIAADRLGSEEPLYHGFENVNGTRFAVGDTLTLPTTATSGDARDSVGYGVRLDPADQRGTPTLFEFPQGTPMVGYSRWAVADQKDFGHIWSEAIVAGRFTVAGVREEHGVSHHWNDPLVQTVSLRPTETFDPATKAWRPVETSLLGG